MLETLRGHKFKVRINKNDNKKYGVIVNCEAPYLADFVDKNGMLLLGDGLSPWMIKTRREALQVAKKLFVLGHKVPLDPDARHTCDIEMYLNCTLK